MTPQGLLQEIISAKAKRDLLIQQAEEYGSMGALQTKVYERAVQGRTIVQTTAKETQESFEIRFSGLVSTALAAVFGEGTYTFQARFVERRNKTECDLILLRDGAEYNPMDASGGGVVDVVSLALSVSFWALKKTRPVFVLDERLKFLSSEYQDAASEMIKMLSTKLGIQFIMVSHHEKMIAHADKVFLVENGVVTEGTSR